MAIDYERIVTILLPLESVAIAEGIRDIIRRYQEEHGFPKGVIDKLIDRLIVKHDIQGDNKDFLESLKGR